MAEVLEPEPGIAEGAAAQDLETPGWKTPGDADPQVGASRAHAKGAGRGGRVWGRGGALLQPICSVPGGFHCEKYKGWSEPLPPFLHKPENSVGEPLPRILAASQFLFLFFLCRGGNKIDHVSEPAVGHSGQRGRNRCFFLT